MQLALPEPFRVMTTAIEHYQATEKMWASLFLAMPDHLHALLSFPRAVRMVSRSARLETLRREANRHRLAGRLFRSPAPQQREP